MRSRTPSLASRLETWFLTVPSVITRRAAISWFERPAARARSTSDSRSVSGSGSGGAAGAWALGAPAARRENSATTLRAMLGQMSAAPAATARTAATISSLLVSLSM